MNRNKTLILFAGNLANVIVHRILEKAIDKPEIAQVYTKEMKNSFEIAKAYRNKINPVDKTLPSHDIDELKQKVINKVKAELNLRISKGYKNINLSLGDDFVQDYFKELKIS
jgi:hypothetical protein